MMYRSIARLLALAVMFLLMVPCATARAAPELGIAQPQLHRGLWSVGGHLGLTLRSGPGRHQVVFDKLGPAPDKSGILLELTPELGLFVMPWLEVVLGVNARLGFGEQYDHRQSGHRLGATLGARLYWRRAARLQPYLGLHGGFTHELPSCCDELGRDFDPVTRIQGGIEPGLLLGLSPAVALRVSAALRLTHAPDFLPARLARTIVEWTPRVGLAFFFGAATTQAADDVDGEAPPSAAQRLVKLAAGTISVGGTISLGVQNESANLYVNPSQPSTIDRLQLVADAAPELGYFFTSNFEAVGRLLVGWQSNPAPDGAAYATLGLSVGGRAYFLRTARFKPYLGLHGGLAMLLREDQDATGAAFVELEPGLLIALGRTWAVRINAGLRWTRIREGDVFELMPGLGLAALL